MSSLQSGLILDESKECVLDFGSDFFGVHGHSVQIKNIDVPNNFSVKYDYIYYKALEEIIVDDVNRSNDVVIDFKSNLWDFSYCFKYEYASWRLLNFESVPEEFRVGVKCWVIKLIRKDRMRLSTIWSHLSNLKLFFSSLDLLVIKGEYCLTTYDIEKFLDYNLSIKYIGTFYRNKVSLKCYCEFLVLYCGCDIDLNLFKQYVYVNDLINKNKEYHKIPTIPRWFYNKLLTFFIDVFNNDNETYENRGIAGMYIILSQTGLRPSEIVSLTKDCLVVDCERNGKKIYKLRVRSFKRMRGLDSEESMDYYTFANELTVFAFQKLCELTAPRMAEYGLNFIYLSTRSKSHRVLTSCLKPRARELLAQRDFCIAENKNCSIEGVINAVKVSKYDKYVYLPDTKQFRVFLCSELYHTYQVPFLWIQKFMGHLTSEMQGYYVRPKDDKHKVAEESNKLLRDILDDKVTLLGDEGSELTNKIKAFIKEGNYNVEKDIDKIFDEFKNVAAVTLKQDGFCTKRKLRRLCYWDEQVSQAHINFGEFLNNCHVYYMAARSYEDYKLLQKTFTECDSQGYEVEASRELNHLKALCRKRLLPELTDMMAKVDMRGYDAVVSDYPDLKPLIDDYDGIYKEVQKWLKKTY